MLELLLKYEPALYARGVLELRHGTGGYVAACTLAAVLVTALAWRARARLDVARTGVLYTLRLALFALALFILFEPRLRVTVDEQIRGHVAILVDDSASMRIADDAGLSRAQWTSRFFAPGKGDVSRVIESRFDTRHFRFARDLDAHASTTAARFAGARSRLGHALERLAARPEAASLAAIVVVSDGAVAANDDFDAAISTLGARGVTIHGVAANAAPSLPDIEIERIALPDSVLIGATVEVDVGIRHRGVAGAESAVIVERDGAIIAQSPLSFARPSGRANTRIALRFDEPGPSQLTFRVPPVKGESRIENNRRRTTLTVRDRPLRVLHFEGEPRFEVKFLRRAVAAEPGIRVISLVRTAENKFYRLGIENAQELESGFPDNDEALFRYDAVVIGNTDADLLGEEGQRRLRAFVARRGGGLVTLGGKRALAEGGYAESILAGVLPVALERGATGFDAVVHARVPEHTGANPGFRLFHDRTDAEPWARLPPLSVVNPIRSAKPGATILLEGEDSSGDPLVLIATHRYGRGAVTVFAVRNTWRWQMHPDLPTDDPTHEQLWSRLLRDVARFAAPPSHLHALSGPAALGDRVELRATILDAAYQPRAGADARVLVTTPLGESLDIALEPTDTPGLHAAALPTQHAGQYDLQLIVDGASVEGDERHLLVDAAGDEFHDSGADSGALERITRLTGGSLFDRETATKLPDSIDDRLTSRSVDRHLPLWDVPLFLFGLLALASTEWALRRRAALP